MVVRRYALEAPNEACSLRLLRGFLTPLLAESCGSGKCSKQAADRLVLAVDEACANQVRHRCPTIDDGALRLEVAIEDRAADNGAKECRMELRLRRFCRMDQADEIRSVAPDSGAPDSLGGRGLAWMHEIMDRVELEPVAGTLAADLVLTKEWFEVSEDQEDADA